MYYIKKYLKFIITIFVCIFIVCFYFIINRIQNHENKNDINDVVAFVETTTSEEVIVDEVNNFYVDVKGEVKNPGVYFVSDGMLVIDQTTPNMIQRLSGIFARNPLIYGDI